MGEGGDLVQSMIQDSLLLLRLYYGLSEGYGQPL